LPCRRGNLSPWKRKPFLIKEETFPQEREHLSSYMLVLQSLPDFLLYRGKFFNIFFISGSMFFLQKVYKYHLKKGTEICLQINGTT
jgi:hypothetical protein